MQKNKNKILITCEHGGNKIPAQYQYLFRHRRNLLESHQGYDVGALQLARQFSRSLNSYLAASTISRLLIELNRSIGHISLFSEVTRKVPSHVRQDIFSKYYLPYREKVESYIGRMIGKGYRVIHISCHSFTPKLNGQVRNNDIGLLYDPARLAEKNLCHEWKKMIEKNNPSLKVRFNYPYLGTSDGFVTYLRKCFPQRRYIGIELEINQKQIIGKPIEWKELRSLIINTFQFAYKNQ